MRSLGSKRRWVEQLGPALALLNSSPSAQALISQVPGLGLGVARGMEVKIAYLRVRRTYIASQTSVLL